jgi:hypothetical protein
LEKQKPNGNAIKPVEITETKDYIEDFYGATELMRSLIRQKRSLAHLASVPIKILFRKNPYIRNGKMILGSAAVCSQKDRIIHGHWFVIVLDLGFWEINEDRREALLFHELMHCGVDKTDEVTKPVLIAHDLEEFTEVVKEYGLWKRDVEDFAQQLELISNVIPLVRPREDK